MPTAARRSRLRHSTGPGRARGEHGRRRAARRRNGDSASQPLSSPATLATRVLERLAARRCAPSSRCRRSRSAAASRWPSPSARPTRPPGRARSPAIAATRAPSGTARNGSTGIRKRGPGEPPPNGQPVARVVGEVDAGTGRRSRTSRRAWPRRCSSTSPASAERQHRREREQPLVREQQVERDLEVRQVDAEEARRRSGRPRRGPVSPWIATAPVYDECVGLPNAQRL